MLMSYERTGWVEDEPARLTGRMEVRPAAELGPIIVCLDTSGTTSLALHPKRHPKWQTGLQPPTLVAPLHACLPSAAEASCREPRHALRPPPLCACAQPPPLVASLPPAPAGSMYGPREVVAKAVALECMRGAHRQQRRCYLYAFRCGRAGLTLGGSVWWGRCLPGGTAAPSRCRRPGAATDPVAGTSPAHCPALSALPTPLAAAAAPAR